MNLLPNDGGPLLQRKKQYYRSHRIMLLLMALPCFAFVIVFSYAPLFGWVYAFFDYTPGIPLAKSELVGLKFFALAMDEPELVTVMRNTFVLSFLGLALSPLPAVFAIMLSEISNRQFSKLVQTVTTLPYFISWILVYSIFYLFFSVGDGIVNPLLMGMGLIDAPINWLADIGLVWPIQTLIGLWKGLGFSAIIYFAAIAGIDSELYDAAAIDGAGRLQKIWNITIPGLVSTYMTLLLLGIGNILTNGFEQYYVFYNPVVHDRIQVLDYYLYRIGLTLNDYSLSTALGIFKTLFSVALLFSANWVSKKIRGEAIF